MKISELRKAGEILGREGLAIEALKIAQEMTESGSYKKAIEGAGRLKVIAQACTFDSYWEEKMIKGEQTEVWFMENTIKRIK